MLYAGIGGRDRNISGHILVNAQLWLGTNTIVIKGTLIIMLFTVTLPSVVFERY
jgi:hypothetical protein